MYTLTSTLDNGVTLIEDDVAADMKLFVDEVGSHAWLPLATEVLVSVKEFYEGNGDGWAQRPIGQLLDLAKAAGYLGAARLLDHVSRAIDVKYQGTHYETIRAEVGPIDVAFAVPEDDVPLDQAASSAPRPVVRDDSIRPPKRGRT